MNHVPEQPLLDHVQASELEKVIAAILQHHAVPAGPLGGIDERPALGDAGRGGHLDGDVLAVLHGIHRHRRMQLPRHGEIDKVDVVQLAKRLPALLAGELVDGPRSASLDEARLGPFDPLGKQVAERSDRGVLNIGHPLRNVLAPVPETDDADADGVDRVAGEAEHALLPGRPRRRIIHDPAASDSVAVIGCAGAETKHERRQKEKSLYHSSK